MLFCSLKISGGARRIEYHLPAAIKKKPLRQGRRGCFFSSQSGWPTGKAEWLTADVAVEDFAEQLPGLALEPLQLNLRDRGKIGCRGIDLDAGQQAPEFEVLDAGRLLH